MTENTEITADRSVVTSGSRLDNVRIKLEASVSETTPDVPEELHQAIRAFSEKLEQVEKQHTAEVEFLALLLEGLMTQLAQPTKQRKKELIVLSAQGLKDAAKTIAGIAPGLIETAKTIAEKIANWLP